MHACALRAVKLLATGPNVVMNLSTIGVPGSLGDKRVLEPVDLNSANSGIER